MIPEFIVAVRWGFLLAEPLLCSAASLSLSLSLSLLSLSFVSQIILCCRTTAHSTRRYSFPPDFIGSSNCGYHLDRLIESLRGRYELQMSIAEGSGLSEATATYKYYSAAERNKKFGLECTGPNSTDAIVFRPGWVPGGEYSLKLTVRNVSGSLKKFKYRLPSSRFFSMAFPEWVTLPPGCFVCLEVVFRPVELAEYDDAIAITVRDSHERGFLVPVRALLSNVVVTVPPGIDFGYCPTHQDTEMVLEMVNSGEIDAPFRWESPHPFRIHPEAGIIPFGEKMVIHVSICPSDASVFVGT